MAKVVKLKDCYFLSKRTKLSKKRRRNIVKLSDLVFFPHLYGDNQLKNKIKEIIYPPEFKGQKVIFRIELLSQVKQSLMNRDLSKRGNTWSRRLMSYTDRCPMDNQLISVEKCSICKFNSFLNYDDSPLIPNRLFIVCNYGRLRE